MVVRVSSVQERSPPRPETVDIVLVRQIVACTQFVMDQGGSRLIDDPPAVIPAAQTKIHVIVDNAVLLVKAADRLEPASPDHYASARYRQNLACAQGQPEISWVRFGHEAKCMPSSSRSGGPEYSCVLHGSIRVKQASANQTDFRPLGLR